MFNKSSSSAASDRLPWQRQPRTTASTPSSTSQLRRAGRNEKGEYETGTERHRVYAWNNLSEFARTLRKGQVVTLEGTLRYREVEAEGQARHRIAEIHATSMKRLSRIEAADGPGDGAGEA